MTKKSFQDPKKSAYNKERMLNYQLDPVMEPDFLVKDVSGYAAICEVLRFQTDSLLQKKGRAVLVIDCYDGIPSASVYDNLVKTLLPTFSADVLSCKYPENIIASKFESFINPADSTYGVFSPAQIGDFFDIEKVEELRTQVQKATGLVIIYGIAASYLVSGDILVYGNITKMELQTRLMKGMNNWGAGNYTEDYSRKEKRGTFLDWRALDPHKRKALSRADFVMDCTNEKRPTMITGEDFRQVIKNLSKKPFQLTPIFMPAVWGGKWIQKITGVGKDQPNMGWAINGYLDIQSLKIRCQNGFFEFPGNDMVHLLPRDILGDKIFYFWGYKCPIHTNILDTWEGGNLSLQVHPTTAYAMEAFNSPRGHHESYYILDTKGDKSVYLGLKNGTKVTELVSALEEAQITGSFDEEKYVNQVPVKKHDHLSIPGGTLHCSGEGNVVLEIDEFWFATLKLWDWGRLDLDGKPRPIHINHGRHCIQENFQSDWVKENLISSQPVIAKGDGWSLEDSSTMPYEPMKVLRYWFSSPINLTTDGIIHILVLVEGEEAVIESIDNSFAPFPIHYAEATFIPAACQTFRVRPADNSNSDMGLLSICYPM